MTSFPSAFNKNPAVSTGIINVDITNLKGSLQSSLSNLKNSALAKLTGGASAVTREQLGENIDFTLAQDKYWLNNVNRLNYSSNTSIETTPRLTALNRNGNLTDNSLFNNGGLNFPVRFENPFKLPSSILSEVNQYMFTFKNLVGEINNEWRLDPNNNNNIKTEVFNIQGAPSLFNPNFAVHVWGLVENIPLINNDGQHMSVQGTTITDESGSTNGIQVVNVAPNRQPDISDCSIKTLVELSKKAAIDKNNMGRCQYRYADFMYCKELGKISNNHLITLRKFPHPIGDNIWQGGFSTKADNTPDVGRMVTWLGENNKLEDICKYDYNATWKPLNAKIQEKQSEEEDERRGIVGSITQVFSPKYNMAVGKGTAGSGNMIYNWIANSSTIASKTMSTKGTYENHQMLSNYDNNRVYEPTDTIQDTHIYEGKLQFNHEFNLVFTYKLRAYDNINPKSAFLDLIGNILHVTYRKGKFWGGAHKIVGSPSGDNRGYDKLNNFIDQSWSKLGGFLEGILTGNINWGDIMASVSNAFKGGMEMLGNAYNSAKDVVESPGKRKELVKKAQDINKKYHLGDAFKGMLKNKLGRPAIYAFDSLLSGSDVGLWHVTIGNPRNPIMAFGNLILTKASIQHSGPLGIDDFPTELKVTVTLKHARSRDATDIAHMYTRGQNGIYMSFTASKFEKYFNMGATKINEVTKAVKADKAELTESQYNTAFVTGTLNSDQFIASASHNNPQN